MKKIWIPTTNGSYKPPAFSSRETLLAEIPKLYPDFDWDSNGRPVVVPGKLRKWKVVEKKNQVSFYFTSVLWDRDDIFFATFEEMDFVE